MKSFMELRAWQEGHKLAVEIYRLTDAFPKSDMFGLSQQIQRTAISVTSNVAEGFGRQTQKDTLHFYVMARGSITELQNQIILARDVGRLDERKAENLSAQSMVVIKLIGGLIRSTNNRISS